jgi:hypothetical protein
VPPPNPANHHVLSLQHLVRFIQGTKFGLALQLARCELVRVGTRSFSKQSIFKNPAARPAERKCSAGFFLKSVRKTLAPAG